MLPLDEAIDSIIEYAERMEAMRDSKMGKESDTSGLQWKWNRGTFQQGNFDQLMNEVDGCLPVDVFEKLFNDKMRKHIITETQCYARVAHNDDSFTFFNHDLKHFTVVLLYSGYHTFPPEHLYWERQVDVESKFIHNVISKNKVSYTKEELSSR